VTSAPRTGSARGARIRAPELRGRRWLNTGGAALSLADLRGSFVLLDFWTFCCVNCLHVLDELRPLEDRYADVLVVVGVHSPKFAHERDPDAVAAAVERYGVAHPVLDDPDLRTWAQYAAKAWPTLALVDPEGYLVASMAGEGHAEALDRMLTELVAEYDARGTLRRRTGPSVPTAVPTTALRFPGKVAALSGGTLLVSDSAHHRLVELTADGATILRRIGAGIRGRADGDPATARFSEPQGLCVLPAEVAAAVGYDVLVADTVNHLLRGVRLADGDVRTVAGTGRPWRGAPGDPVTPAADPVAADLSSPWDLAWYPPAGVVVAMAGIHQLWSFDPRTGRLAVYAGTGVESLRDGPLDQVWMAQPSGLAVDGGRLWVVDAETSALRSVEGGVMRTAVGQGLFDFGHVDGAATDALLQHPLGVAVLPDGSVAVCDTYNDAIRRYDPARAEVTTLATGIAEPSGAAVVDGALVVVESAAHRVRRLEVSGAVIRVPVGRHRTRRPPTDLASGEVQLEVAFEPAPGQRLDGRYGPATSLEVTADPPSLLREGAGAGDALRRRLVLAEGSGVLQVVARAAACDEVGEHPACHLVSQDWGVPVRVASGGASRLTLVLRGQAGGGG
jgi:thiol-disulfide isomerase/thioredoxin